MKITCSVKLPALPRPKGRATVMKSARAHFTPATRPFRAL